MRRKRKVAKETRLRLVDLHRRKTELLTKQINQEKVVVEKIQKTTDGKVKDELIKVSFFVFPKRKLWA